MNNERIIYFDSCADFSKIEERVVGSLASEIEALRKTTTGRNTVMALVACGAAFGKATLGFELIAAALRRMDEQGMTILSLQRDDGVIVDGYSKARNGTLTSEDLQRAADTPLEGKTIAVEYHAPVAPGRRKVGGAQWKSERRGGFSRR